MKKIDLEKNIQLCFNIGFKALVTIESEEDYRIAICNIHNGLELLMKYYLKKIDEVLIYKKPTYKTFIRERTDLKKKVKLDNEDTISYMKCIEILEYFSELPGKNKNYLKTLNFKRGGCSHFEYFYDEKELRKLLISHIYQFICDLIIEMGLEIKHFIPESYVSSLDRYKTTIDDEIKQEYQNKIEIAKRHYFEELTTSEREQKTNTEDYTQERIDEIVKCPACRNNALLKKKVQRTSERIRIKIIISRDLILKDLSCHHCGLNITDYDQLKIEFKDKEKSLMIITIDVDYSAN